jgi:hypothetical protein
MTEQVAAWQRLSSFDHVIIGFQMNFEFNRRKALIRKLIDRFNSGETHVHVNSTAIQRFPLWASRRTRQSHGS